MRPWRSWPSHSRPWRFSFDRATGDLFIGDVGQSRYEEIDFQPAAAAGGENYGWRLMEASACFDPSANCDPNVDLVRPIIEYGRDIGQSVTGGLKNRDTILSDGLGTEAGPNIDVGDARQDYVQTYKVIKRYRKSKPKVYGKFLTPPPNVGRNVIPDYNDADGRAVSGATDFFGLDTYTQQTIYELPSGEVIFAGPREDGFFADTPAIFDLLDDRILGPDGLGQTGSGVDGFKGYNVLAFAVQIPLSELPSYTYPAPFADLANPLPASGQLSGVGVYASVSRPRFTLRKSSGKRLNSNSWVMVNRMGNPLFNEVLVALRDKDRYNGTSPTRDDRLFKTYALNPEIARLLNLRFNLGLAETGRSDLDRDVGRGKFREDLMARINLWTFRIPGLRERAEDIEPNLDYELDQFARKAGRRVTINKEARRMFLDFAASGAADWRANFRDLNGAVTRMATLVPRGRITTAEVREEAARLRDGWQASGRPRERRRSLLAGVLTDARLAGIDSFDQAQLEEVLRVCTRSRSLSEAGRRLFSVSRRAKKMPNDADRLRKYLARFGLKWGDIVGG